MGKVKGAEGVALFCQHLLHKFALVYFSGPWENSLTLPDQTSIPFPNPDGSHLPLPFPVFHNIFFNFNFKCQKTYSKNYQNLTK